MTLMARAFAGAFRRSALSSGVRHTPGPDIGGRFSRCRNGDVSPQFGAGGRERSWTVEPGSAKSAARRDEWVNKVTGSVSIRLAPAGSDHWCAHQSHSHGLRSKRCRRARDPGRASLDQLSRRHEQAALDDRRIGMPRREPIVTPHGRSRDPSRAAARAQPAPTPPATGRAWYSSPTSPGRSELPSWPPRSSPGRRSTPPERRTCSSPSAAESSHWSPWSSRCCFSPSSSPRRHSPRVSTCSATNPWSGTPSDCSSECSSSRPPQPCARRRARR